ncbi:GNAT family N-acetyltransferase [Sphingomonas cavernae]|uniref:N-acetyltransferase n=1 Tax=Sphingomonas cavernae TaxID=2320861 RepID=A0A418W7K6_9SPHN|nr:GNAT family N-acetyltransferase [Sphingomonas cavernae]RJF85983.1 N-acetyltransferase [Sphingomonas cavernae]
MFVRTERLLLRPGWVEDAPALARAIGEEAIVRNLATAPWPYDVAKARAFLSQERDARLPSFLIFARTHGAPRLVGGCGLGHTPDGKAVELGYWIGRPHWGLGYATEAGRALVELAHALGIRTLTAGHFVDNPASGRVLRKLGFRPTGRVVPRGSEGRGEEAPCALYVRDAEDGSMPCPTPPVPLAA